MALPNPPPAAIEDTGDVIMLDIDDPPTVLAITEDLLRQRKSTNLSRKRQPFDRLRQILPSDVAGLFIVDTNFAISHLSIIKGLVDSYKSSKALVLIPWVVVQELDGLKTASSDYGQANLATLARNAVRYIYDCLRSSLVGLRGQKMNECLAAGEFGDDAILDCARYWHEKQDLKSVLLSNDRNLCTKIMIHGMTSISHEPGLSAASILESTRNSWHESLENIPSFTTDKMAEECSMSEDFAETMEIDESPEFVEIHNHMTSSPETQTRSSPAQSTMQTEVVVAPLFNPKSTGPDPFAALAARAGISRFETISQAANTSGGLSDQSHGNSRLSKSPVQRHSPKFSRSRTQSPDTLDLRRYSRSSVDQGHSQVPRRSSIEESLSSRNNAQEILRDLETTMVSALPSLIRKQMKRELHDTDSVDFLLQDGMDTIEAITKTIVKNWFVCFGHMFPEHKKDAGAYIQTLSSNLRQYLHSFKQSQSQADRLARGWIEVWRRLSDHDVVSIKYKQRQEKRISYWLEHLKS
ncbi:Transcriptional protein swt1 [Taphrina deformans PYCC 5710]|uniref:Transcriptional protein swt1 n=1 Tax=Taphrina deformans (strain PYCC 5710 / ATCC 11124 / CBS 356.35 / IMI 108563 / JCM 9778 / NBRC 8474) TaxID=1097556 RepID=R4XAT2_TAPDE|nr:Transcriptional protein swt1 [Taphrina deformans PYCC 5710]|eukprot:CCG82928.1 Transcriptional protein swt1 [Taphrina deformans PYCC 5710]